MPVCLTRADFDRYDRGELDETAAASVCAHLDTCDRCRTAYASYREEPIGPAGSPASSDNVADPAVTATVTPSSPAAKVARHIPSIEGYWITGVIGQGGMGIVYQAVQTKLNRTVALKVLPAIVSTANPSTVSRFRREATAAARLHHTHIIPIYDFGEARDGYYYAMELISGHPLDVLIRRLSEHDASTAAPARLAEILTSLDIPPVSELTGRDGSSGSHADAGSGSTFSGRGRVYYQQVARWMADAADALHYAHGQGIVHRDIKPGNLILSVDGRIMIADFGLAKTADEKSVTMTGSFLGTLRYVSPEQAMAKRVRVDHRTDVYSLGATIYELLCFRPAFPGTDDKEILGAIIARDPTPPRKIHHPVPAELDTICLKCLEKSPDARYDSAWSLAEDLRRYMHDLPIAAKRPGFLRRSAKFVKRRKAPVIAVTAAVLLLVASFVVIHQSSARRATQIQAHYESGMFYASREIKDWQAAEQEFLKALAIDSRHVQALLGLAWLKLEHYKASPEQAGPEALEQAEAQCRRVLEVEPANTRALGFQGVALRRLKRYDEAEVVLKKALELEEGAYHSWSNMGTLYAEMRRLSEAETCLREGADRAGVSGDMWHGAAWRNLAALELHLNKEEAVDHIHKAIECWTEDVQTWIIRARLGLELEGHLDFHEALNDAHYADRLAKFKDPRVKRMLALAHLRNHEVENAINDARLALDLDDMPTINHLIIAIAEATRENPISAREHLSAAVVAWPDDLREPGDFRATAATGDLWFESADQLIRLRDEAETLLAGASP